MEGTDGHGGEGWKETHKISNETNGNNSRLSAGLCDIDREDFLDRLDKGEIKWNHDECQFAKQLAKEGVIEYINGWHCGYYQRVSA